MEHSGVQWFYDELLRKPSQRGVERWFVDSNGIPGLRGTSVYCIRNVIISTESPKSPSRCVSSRVWSFSAYVRAGSDMDRNRKEAFKNAWNLSLMSFSLKPSQHSRLQASFVHYKPGIPPPPPPPKQTSRHNKRLLILEDFCLDLTWPHTRIWRLSFLSKSEWIIQMRADTCSAGCHGTQSVVLSSSCGSESAPSPVLWSICAIILAAESGVTEVRDGSGAVPANVAQVMCYSLNY